MLLEIARHSLISMILKHIMPDVPLENLPSNLRKPGACFITLMAADVLRGCTGTLVARQPLAQEISDTTARTATSDPRFPPVRPDEVEHITIEISVLSELRTLEIPQPHHLPDILVPGRDGVLLTHGAHRATFLPQVWARVNTTEEFLAMLCQKMGLPATAWLSPEMKVQIYTVDKFTE